MNATRFTISLLLTIFILSRPSIVQANDFFQKPPKAERAVLSACRSSEYRGQVSIVIETEPLTFLDPDSKQQLAPEIHLEHIALPLLDPAKLANKRFKPGSDYEGSFYFLAEHNWVDLKEIRFLNASSNSLETEFDLVIHLPRNPPNTYPLTLRTITTVKSFTQKLAPPRTVEGLGQLTQEKEDFWKGTIIYDGRPVEIEFHAEPALFPQMTEFIRTAFSGSSMTRRVLDREISKELDYLDWKLKEFKVPAVPRVEEFIPRSFYFHQRRHHPKPGITIVLSHPSVPGHWSLTLDPSDTSSLNWIPESNGD